MHVTVEGILRDELVEVVFKQLAVWDRLGLDMKSRNNDIDFFRWSWTLNDWSFYPRPHTAQFLLRGEALMYRSMDVSRLVDLESYTSRILPMSFKQRLQVLLNPKFIDLTIDPTSSTHHATVSATSTAMGSHLDRVIADGSPTKRAVPGDVAISSAKRVKVTNAMLVGGRRTAGQLPRGHKEKCLLRPPHGAEVIEISDDDDGGKADRVPDCKGKGKGIMFSDVDWSDNA